MALTHIRACSYLPLRPPLSLTGEFEAFAPNIMIPKLVRETGRRYAPLLPFVRFHRNLILVSDLSGSATRLYPGVLHAHEPALIALSLDAADRRIHCPPQPSAQPLYHPRAANPPPEPTPIVRQPPPLPTEVDTVYTLSQPLQTGLEHEGEVWLAQSCQPHRLPRPPADLTEAMLHHECLYTLPYESVDCEAKAYEWLHDLQGSTLLYTVLLRHPVCP